jgi:hypothetical protein
LAYKIEYSPDAENHLRALTARQRATVLDTVDKQLARQSIGGRFMKILELSEATAPLADYAKDLDQEPLILHVDGQPVAALMAIENADLETISLSNNPKFLEILERSRKRLREEGGISPDEMRRRLGLPQRD